MTTTPQTLEAVMRDLGLDGDGLGRLMAAYRHKQDGDRASGTTTTCPICRNRSKARPRSLSGSACRGLIWMYQQDAHQWHHVDRIMCGTKSASAVAGDWSRTAGDGWELTERAEPDPGDDSKSSSGMYRLTQIGRDFVLGLVTVPSAYVWHQRHRRLAPNARQIGIETALGQRFDYAEVMGEAASSEGLLRPYRREWVVTAFRDNASATSMPWRINAWKCGGERQQQLRPIVPPREADEVHWGSSRIDAARAFVRRRRGL